MKSLQLLEPAYEDIRHETGEPLFRKSARNTFRMLWQDWDFDLNQFRGLNLLKVLFTHRSPLTVFLSTIFIKRNPQFLYVVRDEIRLILERFAATLEQLDCRELDKEELQKIEFSIHNILSIYVMFEPHPSETVIIPQLIEDIEGGKHWLSSEFRLSPIDLSPTSPTWKRVLTDGSRIFSYGFSPLNNLDRAYSLLVHSGTTWPSAQGSLLQVIADMWPNKTPGEVFFDWRYDELKKWVDAQKTDIITCGQSLGGSLSILSALAFPKKIKKAFPLSPTALVKDYKKHPMFGAWFKQTPDDRPTPKIQAHPGDFVFYLGQVPEEGFEVYGLKPSGKNQEFKDFRPVAAHMRSYASNAESTIKKYDIVRENNKKDRRFFNNYLTTYGRWLAHLINLATCFVLTPLKRFLAQNKLRTFLIGAALLAVLFFPPAASLILSIPFIPHFASVLATSLLPIFLGATIVHKGVEFLKSPLEKAKALFSLEGGMNLLSLGLYSDLKALYHRGKTAFSHTDAPYPVAKIHTDAYLAKARDIKSSKPPTLLFKIGLSLLILFSALVSAPFLLTAYVVKQVFWDLPRQLFGCGKKNPNDVEENFGPITQRNEQTPQKQKSKSNTMSQPSFSLFKDFFFPAGKKSPATSQSSSQSSPSSPKSP
jgi:pimeloyl-ACP methyl ester carboxylesterase